MPISGSFPAVSPKQTDLSVDELVYPEINHIETVAHAPESASSINPIQGVRRRRQNEIMATQEVRADLLRGLASPPHEPSSSTGMHSYFDEQSRRVASNDHAHTELPSPPVSEPGPESSRKESLSAQPSNVREREASEVSNNDDPTEEGGAPLSAVHQAGYRKKEVTKIKVKAEKFPTELPSQHPWQAFTPNFDVDKSRQDSVVSIGSNITSGADVDHIYNSLVDHRDSNPFQPLREPPERDLEKERDDKRQDIQQRRAREEKFSRYNRSSGSDNRHDDVTIHNTAALSEDAAYEHAWPSKGKNIAQIPKQPVSDLLIRFSFQENHLRPEPICTPLDLASLFEPSVTVVGSHVDPNATRAGDLSDRVISLKSSTAKSGSTGPAFVDVSTRTPAKPRIFDASTNRWEISSRTPTKSDTNIMGAGPTQPDTVGRRKGRNMFPSTTSHDEEPVVYPWESASSESIASESGQHLGGSLEEMDAWDNVKFGLSDSSIQPEDDYRRTSIVYETAIMDRVSEKLSDIHPEKRLSIITVEEVSADSEDESMAFSVGLHLMQLKELEAAHDSHLDGTPVKARPYTPPSLSPFVSELEGTIIRAETADKKTVEATPSKAAMSSLAYLPHTPMKDSLNVSPGSSPRSRGSVRFDLPAHPSLAQFPVTLTRNSSMECVHGTPVPTPSHTPSISASPINVMLQRLRSRSPVRRSAENSPALAEPFEANPVSRPSLERSNSTTHGSVRDFFSKISSNQATPTDEDGLAQRPSFISGNITPIEADKDKKTPRRRTSILELFAPKSVEAKAGTETGTPKSEKKKTPKRRPSIRELLTMSAEHKAAQVGDTNGSGNATPEWMTPTKSQRGNGSPSMRGSIRMGLKKLVRPSMGNLRTKASKEKMDGAFEDLAVVNVDWDAVNKLSGENKRD